MMMMMVVCRHVVGEVVMITWLRWYGVLYEIHGMTTTTGGEVVGMVMMMMMMMVCRHVVGEVVMITWLLRSSSKRRRKRKNFRSLTAIHAVIVLVSRVGKILSMQWIEELNLLLIRLL